jgi:hypothetical protein
VTGTSPPGPVRMADARAAIEQSITEAIGRALRRQHDARPGRHVPRAPTVRIGDYSPGHDASQVPPVPTARLQLHRDRDTPTVIFTWKVESGEPPHPILVVPRRWLHEVVRPGHAVLDGHPILQVLNRDTAGRPVRVLAAVFGGYFDTAMHGWRAHGTAVLRTVTWEPDGAVRLAADERH